MPASRPLLPLLLLLRLTSGAGLLPGPESHPGVCPNQLSPNLWVDAQSTCERECSGDQDCATAEKCCTNVCGLQSCVAARFPDSPAAPTTAASCEGFACPQQGSDCDIWDGQPVCRCRDRCEKEPSFTCASDGLTYYNRCYMDAEACLRGLHLHIVPCKHVLSWPPSSPGPPETTARPTPGAAPMPPALYSSPSPQAVQVGGTASLHCDVSGRPPPAVTWEKQSHQRENLIMRPDQMYGNVVVTSIGQLVLYNARLEDAGLYTCTARNAAGLLRADFPLSVVQREPARDRAPSIPAPAECLPDVQACTGPTSPHLVLWHFDPQRGSCMTFPARGCDGAARGFETYEACHVGRLTEVLEEPEAAGGIARVALEDVLKDDKMGLKFLGTKYLEVTLSGMDWACPCPNMTAGDGPLVIMGEVRDGVAVLDASSYVRAASEKRVKKILELLEKQACELLNRFQD
ncbi:PREDICTED: WAP, Kazal, immunoglobulin, Kunitz and NTR domain-containing protein 1 [Mandrillus leucophaeus]|uniref:WAP, Kazal, immunoglobulin, Kunitz and NTR domain-containing protein 1 n=1 Tax=Mandrillus leucophaeus TaxID=9568 RepID=UPI0005F4F5D6|nr:PREDICTED: WAP, Kazal, immunoglobulin, Kunitz and NTR domain-containing protein 1 [Mandrillus leucophaeus]